MNFCPQQRSHTSQVRCCQRFKYVVQPVQPACNNAILAVHATHKCHRVRDSQKSASRASFWQISEVLKEKLTKMMKLEWKMTNFVRMEWKVAKIIVIVLI